MKRCIQCRYVIDHLTEARCRECGHAFDLADPSTYLIEAFLLPFARRRVLRIALIEAALCTALAATFWLVFMPASFSHVPWSQHAEWLPRNLAGPLQLLTAQEFPSGTFGTLAFSLPLLAAIAGAFIWPDRSWIRHLGLSAILVGFGLGWMLCMGRIGA